jgi:AcrR family transcriptional regulator
MHEVSVGEIARRAGTSRITVYNRFGSKAGLIEALMRSAEAAPSPERLDPREALRQHVAASSSRWAAEAAVHRHLPPGSARPQAEVERRLAERLAAADELRPGCSIREAEDVIGAATSFATFDRLHGDGRRSVAAVAEILHRLAATVLV